MSAGVISERAMRRHYQPLYPNIYVPRGVDFSAQKRAQAAWLWSKRRGIVAGLSAAAMLGAKWIDPSEPAELIHDNRRPPPNLVVRTETVLSDEIVVLGDMRVTTAARTAFDLGRHTLLLIDAGLPPPRTQFRVFDEHGQFVARLDMAYDEVKVGVEYDGPLGAPSPRRVGGHWTDPAVRQRDIDKQFALTELGWLIIRASRDLLRYRRATYVARVETALRSQGFDL